MMILEAWKKGPAPQGLSLFVMLLVLAIPRESLSSTLDYSKIFNTIPVTNETVPSTSRITAYLKKPSNLVRITPGGLAATGITTLAMVYADPSGDEIAEMLFEGTSPTIPDGWVDADTPPAGSGTFYWVGGESTADYTKEGACALYVAGATSYSTPQVSGNTCRGYTSEESFGSWVNIAVETCQWYHEHSFCAPGGEAWQPDPNAKWPADGKISYVNTGNGWQPHGRESTADLDESFVMPDKWHWVTPDNRSGFGTSNYDGSQTIEEWLQKNVDGVDYIEKQRVTVAPDGTVTEVTSSEVEGTLADAINTNSDNIVQIEMPPLPDDYARENTQAEIRDYLKEAPPEVEEGSLNYDGTGFDQLNSGMSSIAEPPSLSPLPEMPSYSSSCQTIDLSYGGFSQVFPTASQCDRLGEMKQLIGWFMYLITAWMIANLLLGVKKEG